METSNDILVLPAGDGDGTTISFDFGRLARAEARMEEAAFLTREKAKEFARAMNRGWLDVATDLLVVHRHLKKADDRAELRKGTVLLDELPAFLVKSGIPQANAEIRKAVVLRDEQYRELKEVVDSFQALQAILKIKQQGFRNCWEIAKKVLGGMDAPPGERDLSHGSRGDEMRPTNYQLAGSECPACHLPQYQTPSGLVCAQNHGF